MKISFYISFLLLFSSAHAQVVIDSVTVNTANQAVITWQPSTDSRTVNYKLYDPTNLNTVIATVPAAQTTYTYSASKAGTKSESFRVAAVDAMDNPFEGFSSIQNTIYLSATVDQCNASASLSWNTYINWPDGVKTYEIWMSKNGASSQLLSSSTNTAFTASALLDGVNYEFHIRTVSGNGLKTSTSNKLKITGSFKKAPSFVYLSTASVLSPSEVEVKWIPDSASTTLNYTIWAGTDGQNFSEVKKVSMEFQKNNLTVVGGLNTAKSYYIRVQTETTCPNTSLESNGGKTIRLTANKDGENINILSWDSYETWDKGVGTYTLYRIVGNTETSLATLGSGTYSYTDNDPLISNTEDVICYYLEAEESAVNQYKVREKSISNMACASKEARIYVPEAFSPDGSNPLFRPVMLSVQQESYSLKIFNRFGQLVFQTTDVNEGWNGKMSNNDVSTGIYVYLISVRDSNGKPVQKQGTVAVVK